MKETFESLKEKGICPTCYNLKHGFFHEDISDRILYEDELIPRHPDTEIGSKNFVKQRMTYKANIEIVRQIRTKFLPDFNGELKRQ